MILDKILRFFIILLASVAGAAAMRLASPVLTQFVTTEILKTDLGFFRLTISSFICIISGLILGGMAGSLLAPIFIRQLKGFSAWVEVQINKMPTHDAIAGVCGLALGLIIANLLGAAFSRVPIIGDYAPVVFSLVFGYMGISILIRKREELETVFDAIPKLLRELVKAKGAQTDAPPPVAVVSVVEKPSTPESPTMMTEDRQYKLLDTNVIIDGRIADVVGSGFLEGTLLVPVFVLEELQHIADSADVLKRGRGRRGLDILQRIRSQEKIRVEVTGEDFDDVSEVDSKLVRLAQKVNGKIITNDYNLNKVAELRGVTVLNINELANAVKPVVIPGETMTVNVVKEGRSQGQGLAYLEDGTMIVIENGHRYLNSTITVEVTSALQTAAGRMIFAKPAKG